MDQLIEEGVKVDFTFTDIPYAEVNRVGNGLRELDKGKADVLTFPDGKAQIKLTLVITDIRHLTRIIQKITVIKEIFSVERT